MEALLFFVLIVIFLVFFMAIPISFAQNSDNYIDVNNAKLEGNLVRIYQVSPFLNYYSVDYTVMNPSSDFVVKFSPYANPMQSSISPSAKCKEITTQIWLIFIRIDGYSCDFGDVSKDTHLHIQFQDTSTPLTHFFSYFSGV